MDSSRRLPQLACAAVAGLALAAAGLAGPAGVARAGVSAPGPVRGGIISTVAGGIGGPGPARSVAVSPCGLGWAGGWLYIGDGSMVRRVSAATGELTTVAGDHAGGPADDSGAAVSSTISACGTVLDGAGNLVIAAGLQVLVVPARTGTFYGRQMTAGHVYAVAGTGAAGPDGNGGPATRAALSDAVNVAFDRAGNLLIADAGQPGNSCQDQDNPVGSLVQVVAARTGTFYGQQMTAGDIYTVAGVQSESGGSAGNGGLATQAWLGNAIGSVRPDRAGNLVLADMPEDDPCAPTGPSVRVIATVTGTFYGMKMTAGHIYRVAGDGQTGSGGDGGPATAAPLDLAGSAVPDAAGNLVIGDGSRVRVVAVRTGRFYGQHMTAGRIYGIAGTGLAGYSGDGGPAVRARVTGAGPDALDGAGNVLLGCGHRVRVVAARTGRFYGMKMTVGDIYTVAGNGTAFSGDGGPPLRAEFTGPTGISADLAGDIAFTADDATMELIPARSGTFFGRRLTAGHLYTVAGDGNLGFRGDGGPARHAEFNFEAGPTVAFAGSGNVVVADGADRVRLIAVRPGRFFGRAMTAGDVYTIAGTGGFGGFSGDGGPAVQAVLAPVAVGADHYGNVLIADGLNERVRVVAAATGTFYGQKMTVGDIYTVAGDGSFFFSGDGGAAVKAGVNPVAVATDATGNLIIADESGRVRLVAARTATMYGQKMTVGDIYTIAGTGGQGGSSGSGGPATKATFGLLGGVTTDRHGNVIFADYGGGGVEGLVWVVAVTDGTFYGQAMTAGDIYAVAGGGTTLGDGGPATSALLGSPIAVAVSRAGSLLVTDRFDNRLRAISP